MIQIYVGGPIDRADKAEADDWRQRLRTITSRKTIDMLLYDPRASFHVSNFGEDLDKDTMATISRTNRLFLAGCDFALFYLAGESPAFGTIREIEYCKERKIPCVVVAAEHLLLHVEAHDLTICQSLNDAVDTILQWYEDNMAEKARELTKADPHPRLELEPMSDMKKEQIIADVIADAAGWEEVADVGELIIESAQEVMKREAAIIKEGSTDDGLIRGSTIDKLTGFPKTNRDNIMITPLDPRPEDILAKKLLDEARAECFGTVPEAIKNTPKPPQTLHAGVDIPEVVHAQPAAETDEGRILLLMATLLAVPQMAHTINGKTRRLVVIDNLAVARMSHEYGETKALIAGKYEDGYSYIELISTKG